MIEEYKDPKAWQFERAYQEAMKYVNEHTPLEITSDISDYVDALKEALHVVNRAACGITYVGSEYYDERGSIYGTLRACKDLHERVSSQWNDLRAEIIENKKLKQEIEDLKARENDAYERGYADCQKNFKCQGNEDMRTRVISEQDRKALYRQIGECPYCDGRNMGTWGWWHEVGCPLRDEEDADMSADLHNDVDEFWLDFAFRKGLI